MRGVSRQFNLLFLTLALPALMVTGCKKKPVDDNEDAVVVQDVETRLSVVAIDPSRIPPDQATRAVLRGAGFERGAQVFVGPTKLDSVEYVDANALRLQLPGMAIGRYDVEVVNPDGASSVLRQGLTVEADSIQCASATVYFDLDSNVLSSAAKSTLDSNLACYRQQPAPIRVEGHCDERGTTDYNLALGQRRAEAVGSHLIRAGLSSSQINRVSFGEERPADPGHDESAWSKNRRAEIIVTR
jgi:peptidoglycan-associated lipoprotein